MKLTGLIEHLYAKIYIAIVEDGERIDVATQIFNGSKKSDVELESFESFDKATLYIQDLISESPYYYISLLNTAHDQGALPTCDKLKMRDFTDVSLTQSLCIDKKWTLYTSSTQLKSLERKHSVYGVDFIFSPFTILQRFFADKIEAVMGLYVLIQQERMSIAVFSNEQLEFASYVVTDADSIALHTESQIDGGAGFELDDTVAVEPSDAIDLDELDDLDTLENIESLDEIESLDDIENIESFEDFAEEADEVEIQEPEESEARIEDFNLDYHRFSLIQDALKTFYTNTLYRQTFIEAVFIADAVGVSSDLKSYLEEELFVTPIVRKIDLAKELLTLSQDEVSHAS